MKMKMPMGATLQAPCSAPPRLTVPAELVSVSPRLVEQEPHAACPPDPEGVESLGRCRRTGRGCLSLLTMVPSSGGGSAHRGGTEDLLWAGRPVHSGFSLGLCQPSEPGDSTGCPFLSTKQCPGVH